jgi:hypothetical protein
MSKTFVKNGIQCHLLSQTETDIVIDVGIRDEDWNWYRVVKVIPKKDIVSLMESIQNEREHYEI